MSNRILGQLGCRFSSIVFLTALVTLLAGCNRAGKEYEAFDAIASNDLSALDELLSNGFDPNYQYPNSKPFNGQYLIHLASEYGNLEALKLIVAYGGDINARDKGEFGDTPLMWIVNYSDSHGVSRKSYYACFQYLVDEGADLTIPNKDGETLQDYIDQFEDKKSPFRAILLDSETNRSDIDK